MNKHLLLFLIVLWGGHVTAQVQIDKPVELTGGGTDGRVTGITSVADSQDAVSAEAVQYNSITYALASHSGNAYSVTLTPAPGSYTAGLVAHFKSQADNTGSVTLNVNSLGAIAVKKNFNIDLAANDIRNGQLVSVMYDGTNFQMLSQTGNAAGGTPSCPSGYQDAGYYCIETNERSSANWSTANTTCMNNNARLCTPSEWKHACNNAGALGLTNMLNNAREWTGQLVYETTACDCSGYAITQGYSNTGASGCDADYIFNSYGAKVVTDSYAYRCCIDQ